eukprot:SAG11_NODE_3619_length_2332_cov_4.030452_3_plen_113_part_00
MRQIAELEQKKVDGAKLTLAQVAKVATKSDLLAELDALDNPSTVLSADLEPTAQELSAVSIKEHTVECVEEREGKGTVESDCAVEDVEGEDGESRKRRRRRSRRRSRSSRAK